MHDWVEKLLELQEKDMRIAKLEAQVESAPGEKAKVERLLDSAKTGVAEAKANLQGHEKALKNQEIQADSIRERMRDFQKKSTMIRSNEEYRAALVQIESCKVEIDGLEDKELEIMEDIEAARDVLKQRQKELAAAEERVAEMRADLDTRVANCTAQLERLNSERPEVFAAVENAVANKYERIRKKKRRNLPDQRIFVPIRDDVCDRCHMNVIAQLRMNARKGVPVTCEYCSALLYWED